MCSITPEADKSLENYLGSWPILILLANSAR
jgi:hypothetical protein